MKNKWLNIILIICMIIMQRVVIQMSGYEVYQLPFASTLFIFDNPTSNLVQILYAYIPLPFVLFYFSGNAREITTGYGKLWLIRSYSRERLYLKNAILSAAKLACIVIGQTIIFLICDGTWNNLSSIKLIQVIVTYFAKLQMEWLAEQRKLPMDELKLQSYATKVADSCYEYVLDILQVTRPVVEELSKKYKLVLVSNFYGNIQTILKDFGLLDFFDEIIESSVVGVRKPDPAIYRLGVDAMGFVAKNVLVVGDSFSKDVVPAKAVGCRVAWLKGEGWGGEVIDESVPDVIITNLAQLPVLL